jgi:hypothetical protein
MPRSDIVRKAIALGRDKGFLTFGELNELLNELWPSTTIAPEDIEDLMTALSEEGINVVEDEGP